MYLRPLLLVLAGLSLCTGALANERRYNVEIVILENIDPAAATAERWRPEVVVPEIEGAVALEGPVELAPMVRREGLVEAPEGFEILPSEQRQLGGAIRKLQESGEYRVLRHLAWQQPALDDEQAPEIRVHQGEAITVRVPITDFEELYALEESGAAESGANATASAGDTESSAADDPGAAEPVAQTFGADRSLGTRLQPLMRPVEVHPLDGTVRLVVSRYLHIHTDLYFTTPVEWTEPSRMSDQQNGTAPASADEGEQPEPAAAAPTRIARGPDGRAMLSYPFVQHRRMRSGELHYLDHPVLGLLIRVDRAEEAEAGGSGDAPAAD